MDIQQFINLRPVLYHLTDERNLESILSDRVLKSTERLANKTRATNRATILRTRRPLHIEFKQGESSYHIRDQRPLSVAIVSKALEKGCTVEDFIYLLNNMIFFWAKPQDLQTHFNRYANEGEYPIILRVNTIELVDINTSPLFCKVNSGGPRCSSYLGGNPVERGYNTFQFAQEFQYTPSAVREVTFKNQCHLPESLYLGKQPDGRFKKL